MKALFLVVLFTALVACQAKSTCFQKYNTCRLSTVAKPPGQCMDQFATCAAQACSCMDFNTAAVHACSFNTTAEIDQCIKEYTQYFTQCVNTCSQRVNISEIHLADTHLVTIFGLPSKCSICTHIVGFAESKGEGFACDALNLADIVPGCDFLGPICGFVLNEICSTILDHIVSHTPLNSNEICQDAGFCKKGLVADAATQIQSHQVASVVTLSKKGASQFLNRHAKSASQSSVANCFATPHAKGKPRYTCMEQLNAQANVVASPSTTSSSSDSSSHSELGLGIGIGVGSAFAVMAVVAAIVRFRRSRN